MQFATAQLCLFCLAGQAFANTTDPGTIMVLGDSISAGYGIQRERGWVSLLATKVRSCEASCGASGERTWQVVNASMSGETTTGGLARLHDLLATHEPGIVIIELGGNDGLRGFPTDRIRSNLEQMIRLVSENDATPVVMAMRIPANYGPRYTRAFESAFADAAASGALLIPFLFEDVAVSQEMMQDDGIHPTADAQPLILDGVWSYLAPLL